MFGPLVFWKLDRFCQKNSDRFEHEAKMEGCWQFQIDTNQPSRDSGWYSFTPDISYGNNKFWMRFNGLYYRSEMDAFKGLLQRIELIDKLRRELNNE